MKELVITPKITGKGYPLLKSHLSTIKKIKLLGITEEPELARQIKNGNKKAAEKFIKSNLRFVVSVAKQYQNQGLELPDLINEGNIGLIKAVELFDETRGFKFISYAVWWIRQSILKALSEHARFVRLPGPRVSLFRKYQKTFALFEQQNQREPELWEISELLEVSEDVLTDIIGASARSVKFEAPILGTELCIIDKFVDENISRPDSELMTESLRTHIFTGLKDLSEVERKTIILFFGLDGEGERSLFQVTEILSINFTQAKNAKAKGLMKLREHPIRGALKSYLGN